MTQNSLICNAWFPDTKVNLLICNSILPKSTIKATNSSFHYPSSQIQIICWTRGWVPHRQCRFLFLEALHLEAEDLAADKVVYT